MATLVGTCRQRLIPGLRTVKAEQLPCLLILDSANFKSFENAEQA